MKITTVRGPWFSLGFHVDFQRRYVDLHLLWWIVTIGRDYYEQDTSHSFDRLLNMCVDGTADVLYIRLSKTDLQTLMGAVSNDLIAVSRRLAVQKMDEAVEQQQREVRNNLWEMKERLSRLIVERAELKPEQLSKDQLYTLAEYIHTQVTQVNGSTSISEGRASKALGLSRVAFRALVSDWLSAAVAYTPVPVEQTRP